MQRNLQKLKRIRIQPKIYNLLPATPGVYVFWQKNTPVYIGKAINLKSRVSSYFSNNLEPKTARMVSEADSVSFIRVDSELESLLLEAKLIRANMPHYNVAAKDDKHPLYIAITKEKYPRIVTIRKIATKNTIYKAVYGPFPSSNSVRSVLKMLRRIFPYSDHKVGKRGCLYSHIGLCKPCPSEIESIENSQEKTLERNSYLQNIRNIKAILDGKIGKVISSLQKEMLLLSKTENYEEATIVRDRIKHLHYITQPQIPTEFFLDNPNLYEDLRKREVGELRRVFKKYAGWRGYSTFQVEDLDRIECFDVAHLAGTFPTASMVTFIKGQTDERFYRHFRIRSTKKSDDYAAMREVAKRRAKHFEDWGKPNLIIVDGGKGQVKAFTTILNSILVDVPVVGIAKNPDRLIIGKEKVKLTGSALNLVQRIRDEAHRFARRYHHKLVAKSMVS